MQEFEKCPFGITGLETSLALTLDLLFHSGRLSLPRVLALFTSQPARVIGWKGEHERGALRPGSVGDVTILDPDRKWTYDVNESESKSRNSPFHNRSFRGGPVATIVRGRLVWRTPTFPADLD